MAKKILILSSSPRRGGNSDSLCDEFARGAREAGHDVEKIFLRDRTIHYCTGCGTCSQGDHKPCPQHDDAADVIDKMLAADTIVMGTPVYFYTMSAQMKTMLDRCCGLYTEMKGKEFYFNLCREEQTIKYIERPLEERLEYGPSLRYPFPSALGRKRKSENHFSAGQFNYQFQRFE